MSDRSDGSSARERDGRTTDAPPATRRSVEVEYWVIDDDGDLTEPGDLLDAGPGVEPEFVVPLIEVKTTPCETTAELREELFDRVGRVVRRADRQGKGLVPLATPLWTGPIRDREHDRTRIQDRVVGERFEYVRHCAGTHVHVEQRPGREIDQLNVLTALDPALALVNSSPYHGHEPIASGARSMLYRWMAYDRVAQQGRLWRYARSTEEWARRLERRYEEFVTEAVVAGFDRGTVESCFTPEGAAWTPVKLRGEFSTVEWRSPDATLPSQVVRLADDVVGVMDRLAGPDGGADVRIGDAGESARGRADADRVVLPAFDDLEALVEDAVREGLGSAAVRSYLDRMGFDPGAYEPLSEAVRRDDPLDADEARRLRLEYADRLRRDVLRRRPASADGGSRDDRD
jgi:carboxylate-amine ligase